MRALRPAAFALMVLLAACAGLPQHVKKTPSHALRLPETTLGKIVAADNPDNPDNPGSPRKNLSGLRLLTSGDEALASLIALADHAERSLDVQYYLIHADDSSRLLLHHLRLAADRGVRVRLLVDDLNTVGEDRRFMHLSEHAHMEVRVFNPFPGGRYAMWTRFVASATDIPRINHRMHNKLFVADNSLAITGGRNIGDQYFTRDVHSNFIDLDVVAAGAIVPRLSATFDAFWNSKYAYPIASIASPVAAEAVPKPLEDELFASDANWLARDLDAHDLQLLWVPVTVLADRPDKIARDIVPDDAVSMANSIKTLMRSAQHELIVISPYFVPGPEGVELMGQLVRRGVHIRVLTNSLASTDSPLVHNGYARYRIALLKLGVELSEVRPKLGQKRLRFHPFRSSTASLHAKALVIDQNTVFVGSMNMDARSARTNSEVGLVIQSSDIARQVTNLLDDVSADGSYTLTLDHGRIRWESGEAGAEQVWHIDPETTRLQRFALKILAPFAPEELL